MLSKSRLRRQRPITLPSSRIAIAPEWSPVLSDVLELEQGFERVIHISPNAMRQALQLLNIQPRGGLALVYHPVSRVQGLGTMRFFNRTVDSVPRRAQSQWISHMEWRTTQLSRSLKGWFWLGSQDQELPDQNDVLLSLRTALDEVPQGIVLLDASLRARFINRAFRAMWRLPDTLADNGPAFATLLYHGRDMRAYDVPGDALDSYIQRRLTQIRNGDSAPVDLHLASGDIIRCQCTKLPNGGRMLSYIDVTELVRRADNLERLRAALDNIEHGIILLDRELNVEFMNAAVCRLWQLPDTQPGGRPAFSDLVGTARQSKCLGMSGEARACALATHGRWIYATKMDASSARNAASYPTADVCFPTSTLPISSGVPMTCVDLVGRLDFRSASPPGRNSDTFGH